jgi:NADH-quinone oxidoreductase subunit K
VNATLHNYLIVGAILFVLGIIGFLTRRNLITMFLSAEMMLQGVALNLVAFGRYHGNLQGQSFTIFMLTVAACEAAVALALILTLYRSRRSLDVSIWQELREPGQEPIGDEEPLEPDPKPVPAPFPTLTVAGREPESVASSPPGADASGSPTDASGSPGVEGGERD